VPASRGEERRGPGGRQDVDVAGADDGANKNLHATLVDDNVSAANHVDTHHDAASHDG
jgi:hypothetical protein